MDTSGRTDAKNLASWPAEGPDVKRVRIVGVVLAKKLRFQTSAGPPRYSSQQSACVRLSQNSRLPPARN